MQKFFPFVVAALLLVGCESNAIPKTELAYHSGDFPAQESWNAQVAFSDSGRVRAVLDAEHLAQYVKDGVPERRIDSGFRVDFFDGDGRHTSVLTAKRAVIQENNDMEAFENVVITSDDSTVVRTEYIKWAAGEQKIRSDKFVTITKPAETLRGYGFESDQELKNYRIFNASGEAKVQQQ
ncbi:MAG: LPS export ABC transporter periplasmic protein LptC [Rhizobacter sp.]|nr:LPS export ABC transporter periplasmic protein LptC [Chlorobiales bacterium]